MMRARPRAVLGACWLAFFWVQSSRAILYSAMPALSLEIGLTPATVGLITGTLYAGYAIAVYASRVLPVPPGPVSVSRRAVARRPRRPPARGRRRW